MFNIKKLRPGHPHIDPKKVKFYETWAFLILFCIILPISFRTFIYSPFHIPSGSMKPNLLIGDYIFVSKFSYGYSRYSLPFGVNLIEGRAMRKEPKRGDVIVFKLPKDPGVDYIKRLVGLPGDRIQMINDNLYINGEKVKTECKSVFADDINERELKIRECLETLPGGVEHYILDQDSDGPLDNTKEYVVPAGHYFFMGDNRDNSQDSRVTEAVGFVPEANLVGRAEMIFFSQKYSLFQINKWLSLLRKERFFKEIN